MSPRIEVAVWAAKRSGADGDWTSVYESSIEVYEDARSKPDVETIVCTNRGNDQWFIGKELVVFLGGWCMVW